MFKGNRNLLIIALVVIVNALGYGIIIPILYPYSIKFGLNDFQNGLLFALFSICQFIATPIIGRLSDKYGRRPLLISSIAGTALSFFMMAFAPNAFFLFLARALDGITAGNIPVAMAVISDSTKPEERSRGFGIITAAFGFGFIFGPLISGLTVGISNAIPFIVAGLISLAAVLITALFLPETNKHMGEVPKSKLFDFKKLWHMLFDPNVGVTFLISMLFFFAFACGIIFGFQPFAIKVLHLNETQNSFIFVLFGVVQVITQIFIVQRVSKRFGVKKAFSTGILITAAAFLIMFVSRSLPIFVLASIFLAMFNGIVQTLIPTILSLETDAKSQGSVMGLMASYQSIGFIFGPIVGGILASIAVPFPLLLGALVIVGCYFLSFDVLRPGVKKESAY